MDPTKRYPRRGEIWWTNFPTDPPDKGRRPVIIVSSDARNRHERANSVLVIPLSTSVHRIGPAHLILKPGETGLRAECVAQADNISVVLKNMLREPGDGQRALSNSKVCRLAGLVKLAMSCIDSSDTTEG